jgi:serine phosphatase RsbU (regulator of sigma subunit)/anti-sigma regulatory factor (Ser/Thr protein kinase)
MSILEGQLNDAAKRARASVGAGQVILGTGGEVLRAARPEQLRHIYRLSDPVLSELSLEPLLEQLLSLVKQALGVDTVAILLLDDDGKTLVARAAKGLEEEVAEGVRIPIGGGFAGRIASERKPIFIADVDHADVLNPILRKRGVRSLLGVPLIVEADLIGVLHVGTLQPRIFTNEDATILQLAGARAAPVIERSRLYQALEREHRAAVALQRSLLPERLPELVGVRTAARYFAARDEIGGDWYDVMELPRGCVGIAIGDVVGHGVRAAALMGQLRTALRAYALEGYEPGQVLERLDGLLHSLRGHGMATAAYGKFEPEDGKLRFASAGHPPPAVAAKDGDPRLVEISPGVPLGAFPYSSYSESELTLGHGEMFLLYTDGLVEVRGESLDTGLGRLLEAIRGAPSPERMCHQIVRRLVPREGARDDIAFVVLQSEPVPEKLSLRLPAEPSVLAQVRQALRRWLRAHGARDGEIELITLACGEACANAIQHAYSPGPAFFEVVARMDDGQITLAVRDSGEWRGARDPARGRGLEIMESVMDAVEINASPQGTEIWMRRSRAGDDDAA